MNVAVTRARRHLTVVGDSGTVSHDPFLRSLVEYINARGEVWSAEHYRSQITGNTTHIGIYTFAFHSLELFQKQWFSSLPAYFQMFLAREALLLYFYTF